jgi:hypothetical protein
MLFQTKKYAVPGASLARTFTNSVGFKDLWIAGLVVVIALSGVLASKAALAQESNIATFKLRSDPNFRGYKSALEHFVEKSHYKRPNDFCILGQVADDKTKFAWVLWRQGREIILWDGEGSELNESRRKIDLRKDVVTSEGDLHGSTYLVTKSWVEKLEKNCAREGLNTRVGGAKTKH